MKNLINVLMLTFFLSGCNSIEDKGSIYFFQLPINVQDSLISIMRDSFIENNHSLIDFTHDYTLENKKTGPWIDKIRLKNNRTGAYFDLEPNTPLPIIIQNKDIYIPREFNTLVLGMNDSTIFYHYKID